MPMRKRCFSNTAPSNGICGGINIYPDLAAENRIELDALINIRSSQGNRSRGVDDPAIRARIPVHSGRALERGLELLELTIADPRHRHRLKELTRLREVLLDYFLGENQYGSTAGSWRGYFHAYGMAVALRKGSSAYRI